MAGEFQRCIREAWPLQRREIPEPYRVILTGRGQPATIRGKSQRQDHILVPVQERYDFPASIIVQTDGIAVVRSPRQESSNGQPLLPSRSIRGRQGRSPQLTRTPLAHLPANGAGQGSTSAIWRNRPDADSFIITHRDQFTAVSRKQQLTDDGYMPASLNNQARS